MTHSRWAAILLSTLAALACGLSGCGPEERPALRFDGLYRSEGGTAGSATYWYTLRFSEEGTVLGASSTAAPAEVAAWLHEPFENHGSWRLEEDVLLFSCTSPLGTVDYEGEVLQGGLEIRFHSHINERRGERHYEFFELATKDTGP